MELQGGNPLRSFDGYPQRDRSAQRQPRQMASADIEGVEEGNGVVGHHRDGVRTGRRVALAGPAVVKDEAAVPIPIIRNLG